MRASDSRDISVADMLSRASIEVTVREKDVGETLRRQFPQGTDVHVTFLPDDSLAAAQETCIALHRAGYKAIPHLTARNFTDRTTLDSHLARLAAEAKVDEALVIAGDVPTPRGEFGASLDILRTGLLQKHGISKVRIAGHPEGHPSVQAPVLEAALKEKIAFCHANGLATEIVTQFCFEAAPIAAWLETIRGDGIDVPVRLGVAGPASTASLLKFGMRCGVGNSLRALRSRGAQLGKLIGDTTPDELLGAIARDLRGRGLGPIAGIHLYMFGGVRKTGEWLADARRRSATGTVLPSAARA